jgi:short subunit dehydrogenase-like uncharacterized protein
LRSGLLIYGANGYTGRLIARTFARSGLNPVLAGRNAAKLKPLAAELGLPSLAFELTDGAALDAALAGVVAVLHCAGPFSATAAPMVDACLRTGAHYLDITGEIDVFEACAAQADAAAAAGVMLLPGCGFDVVPSDCLAVHVARRLPDAVALQLSISAADQQSPGTIATAVQQIGRVCRVRRNGEIVVLPVPPQRTADFGDGDRPTVGIGWGDVATAYHSTGIPNIDVEFRTTPQLKQVADLPAFMRRLFATSFGQSVLTRMLLRQPGKAPDDEGSPGASCVLLGEARNAAGAVVRSRLRVKGAYWVTAQTALVVARRVLAGEAPAGYQTPALAYGEDLILEVPGSSIEDI